MGLTVASKVISEQKTRFFFQRTVTNLRLAIKSLAREFNTMMESGSKARKTDSISNTCFLGSNTLYFPNVFSFCAEPVLVVCLFDVSSISGCGVEVESHICLSNGFMNDLLIYILTSFLLE